MNVFLARPKEMVMPIPEVTETAVTLGESSLMRKLCCGLEA